MKTLEREQQFIPSKPASTLSDAQDKKSKHSCKKNKQEAAGTWKNGILYSKSRWSDMQDLDGVEPYSSVNLRVNVPAPVYS